MTSRGDPGSAVVAPKLYLLASGALEMCVVAVGSDVGSGTELLCVGLCFGGVCVCLVMGVLGSAYGALCVWGHDPPFLKNKARMCGSTIFLFSRIESRMCGSTLLLFSRIEAQMCRSTLLLF